MANPLSHPGMPWEVFFFFKLIFTSFYNLSLYPKNSFSQNVVSWGESVSCDLVKWDLHISDCCSSSNCATWGPFLWELFFRILIFISLCITCISKSKNSFRFSNKKQLSEICSLNQLSVCSCPTKVIWFG